MLHRWHEKMFSGRRDLKNLGAYRSHDEPMQIISGASYAPKVHFEAPPSSAVPDRMTAFIGWFNSTAPSGADAILRRRDRCRLSTDQIMLLWLMEEPVLDISLKNPDNGS